MLTDKKEKKKQSVVKRMCCLKEKKLSEDSTILWTKTQGKKGTNKKEAPSYCSR